jgi:rhodanese-related sulfurtransferase
MKFLTENLLYIGLMFVSGGMLLWPIIQRRQQGATVNPNGAIALMNQEDAVLLDVRDADAFAKSHVAQAKLVPAADLATRASEFAKTKCIVVMDADGKTAGKAAAALRTAGAARVVVLDGGYAMWLAAGLPVIKK